MAVEVNMQRLLCSLWREEDGQDLIEYSLLITFFALVTAGLISSGLGPITGIWSTSTSRLVLANKGG